eukprot:TRINITY_DN9107_c0_g2_i1.p1 TRINITY_DN9107_c0_g2~~TRINITY_DN9107_c0_g2_i1.p1  ORF type:complete len:184 (-),score=23.83 TRINITY_DN9107_c0_g2_i1:138-689(-)
MGSPLKLLMICILQIALMLFSILIGIGRAECQVKMHSGSDAEIDCSTCVRHSFVTWEQVVLLCVGLCIVAVGISASIFRSKRLCKIYGFIMMVYAFVVGLTSLLTGLDSVVLDQALTTVTDDNCADEVRLMILTTRINAVLFGINCILDIAGAIYAIKSKELFEFQEIADHHIKFQREVHSQF